MPTTSARRRFPSASGVRLPWSDLPAAVRARVEAKLGSPVSSTQIASGGFSPAFAGVVTTRSGERTFVKAVGPAPNREAPTIYRREIRSLRRLPPGLPIPRYLWSFDAGGWVAIATEAIDGTTPRLPWRTEELARVMAAVGALSRTLTPAPAGFPTVAEKLRTLFGGWRLLSERRRRTPNGPESALPRWCWEHLEELVALEARWSAATAGSTLLHSDLRADNILLTRDRVLFVDWPHACVGAWWFDLVLMLPSVAMQGGPAPWETWARLAGTDQVPEAHLRVTLAAVTGFFLDRSMQAPAPGIPTLRTFQRAQGEEGLRWLRHVW